MDAVKFIEERRRMCKATRRYSPIMLEGISPKDIVKEVEEWAAAHPRKTRQSVFLEQWPTAKIRKDGILDIYPCVVCTTKRKDNNCESVAFSCVNCSREFWMQEVE